MLRVLSPKQSGGGVRWKDSEQREEKGTDLAEVRRLILKYRAPSISAQEFS